MFEEEKALKELKGLHPDINISPSKATAKIKLSENTEVHIDPSVPCQDWLVIDLKGGNIYRAKDANISIEERLQLLELSEDLERVYTQGVAK
jgi:hypothetical protein